MSANDLIGLAVLAWLISRQVRRLPIGRRGGTGGGAGASGRRTQVGAVIALVGVIEFVDFTRHHHLPASSYGILAVSLLVGCGFGVARGFTVRIFVEGGQLYRQGTVTTAVLWVLGVGLHLASDRAITHYGGPAGAASASVLLYLALSLVIQGIVLRRRVRSFVGARREA